MSFGSSFGFPFKGENIPKILNIILIFLIIVASLNVAALLFQSSDMSAALIFSAIPLLLGYGLFVCGYMITVIRSVMDGNEILPNASLGRDLGRGFMVLLAGFIYAIPFIIAYVCIFTLAGAAIGGISDSRGAGDSSGFLVVCGAGLVSIFMGFTIGYSYIVGMVRYAAEDTASALFNFGANFSTVTSHLGDVFGLFVRQIGLGLIYGILTQVVGYFAAFFLLNLFYDRNPNIVLMIGVSIAIYIVILSLMLMSQLSSAHLFANFGNQIGIGNRKSKHDEYSY